MARFTDIYSILTQVRKNIYVYLFNNILHILELLFLPETKIERMSIYMHAYIHTYIHTLVHRQCIGTEGRAQAVSWHSEMVESPLEEFLAAFQTRFAQNFESVTNAGNQ
jgi:hypothetical protein